MFPVYILVLNNSLVVIQFIKNLLITYNVTSSVHPVFIMIKMLIISVKKISQMHKMLSRQDKGAHKYVLSEMSELVQMSSCLGGQKEKSGKDRLDSETFLQKWGLG